MKKSIAFITLLSASLLFTACNTPQDDVITFSAMNTIMKIKTSGKGNAARKANQEVENAIVTLENLISTTKETSEVWKLNHNQGEMISVSADTVELATFSLKMAEESFGALNPCLYPVIKEWGFTTEEYKVPSPQVISELLNHTDYTKVKISENAISLEKDMMLDFGAVGKGYAGDRAICILREKGIESALLDLGGNIQVLGAKPDGSEWKIGIRNPWGGEAVAAVFVKDKAVVTSGGYERFFIDENGKKYIHIFNGETGYPVENDVSSVTIVCDSGLYADALSTTLVVLGKEKAIDFWKSHKDFDFIMLLEDKTLITTANLYYNHLQTIFPFTDMVVISDNN